MFFGRKINQYEFVSTLLFRNSILACFFINLLNILFIVIPPKPRHDYSFHCNPLSNINFFHIFALILASILSLLSMFNLLLFGSNFKQPKKQFVVYLQNYGFLFAIFLLCLITFYTFPGHLTTVTHCRNMNYFFKGETFVTFLGIIFGPLAIYEVYRARFYQRKFVKLRSYEI